MSRMLLASKSIKIRGAYKIVPCPAFLAVIYVIKCAVTGWRRFLQFTFPSLHGTLRRESGFPHAVSIPYLSTRSTDQLPHRWTATKEQDWETISVLRNVDRLFLTVNTVKLWPISRRWNPRETTFVLQVFMSVKTQPSSLYFAVMTHLDLRNKKLV